MNEVKDLNAMTDQELSECFAVEVAGWKLYEEAGRVVRKHMEKEEYTHHSFATDANAVLLWLAKHQYWIGQRPGQLVHVTVMPDPLQLEKVQFRAQEKTFPRAACCALIAAKRASVTETH